MVVLGKLTCIRPQIHPNTSVEAEEPHSRPAVHRKEVGLVVVGHSHLAAAALGHRIHLGAVHIDLGPGEAVRIDLGRGEAVHIGLDREEAVHIGLDREGAVHNRYAADHSLAGEDHYSPLEEVRRHNYLDQPGVVVALRFSRP
jgi:hypothetical protein